jgi:hypothetical protein
LKQVLKKEKMLECLKNFLFSSIFLYKYGICCEIIFKKVISVIKIKK